MTHFKARSFVTTLALLSIAGASFAFTQSGSNPNGTPSAKSQPAVAQPPKLIALTFYADWCPGCKALKPKLEEVMGATKEQPCLFIKLDQTDKESHQAEYLAAALGVGELWKEHGGKTGFSLLIDPKTKKVVSTVTADQDVKSIRAAVAKAMNG